MGGRFGGRGRQAHRGGWDSGKHAESVIGGETSILDAMGGRFGGRGRPMHRRGWDLKAKGALKAWQGQCFRAFH